MSQKFSNEDVPQNLYEKLAGKDVAKLNRKYGLVFNFSDDVLDKINHYKEVEKKELYSPTLKSTLVSAGVGGLTVGAISAVTSLITMSKSYEDYVKKSNEKGLPVIPKSEYTKKKMLKNAGVGFISGTGLGVLADRVIKPSSSKMERTLATSFLDGSHDFFGAPLKMRDIDENTPKGLIQAAQFVKVAKGVATPEERQAAQDYLDVLARENGKSNDSRKFKVIRDAETTFKQAMGRTKLFKNFATAQDYLKNTAIGYGLGRWDYLDTKQQAALKHLDPPNIAKIMKKWMLRGGVT